MKRKLGMLLPEPDGRLMKLKDHFSPVPLPAVPVSITAFTKVKNWPMMLNNSIGDCTVAEAGHIIQYWTRLKNEVIMSDGEAIENYSAISGYNPNDTEPGGGNPTDNGAVPETVLNYWVNTGMEAGGGKNVLTGYAQIEDGIQNIKEAIAWTGPVYAGVNLPSSAEQLFENNEVWDVVPGDSVVGGHAIPLIGYMPGYLVTVTWGKLQIMTEAWWNAWGSIAYGLLNKNYSDPTLGINWESVQKNMALVQKS